MRALSFICQLVAGAVFLRFVIQIVHVSILVSTCRKSYAKFTYIANKRCFFFGFGSINKLPKIETLM